MTSGVAARPRVLFVCIGNTCRSVFAEYLGRQMFGDVVLFESAGVSPQRAEDAENAVYTLKHNFGIDASDHVPRDVRTLEFSRYDLIIAFDKRAATVVEDLGAPKEQVKLWKIRDPWGPDLAEYDRASLEIKRKLVQLRVAGGGSDEVNAADR